MTPEQKVIVDLVIERAEQACRYALKHQNFGRDENPEYVSGWTVSAGVCERAIRDQVERHIADDIARATAVQIHEREPTPVTNSKK